MCPRHGGVTVWSARSPVPRALADLRALTTFRFFGMRSRNLRIVGTCRCGSQRSGRIAMAGQERLSQAVSRWAFERDYRGIVHTSGSITASCWAVFDRQPFSVSARGADHIGRRDFVRIARSLNASNHRHQESTDRRHQSAR